jgi:sporulation protein YlmC with PRC-barrel domain
MRDVLALTMLIAALAPAAAHGQTAHQARASKVIGTTVVNDANETIGKVDDVILADDTTPYVVLSVGGFLGVGNRLVALPYDAIRKSDEKLVMPGASKDALKSLPEFTYAPK